MKRNICFFLFIIVGNFSAFTAFQAPNVAPSYPDGWCDLKFGSPTRTTGECICKSGAVCSGSGCQSAQGFIWYAYSQCPTCQCVAATPASVVDRLTGSKVDISKGSSNADGYIIKNGKVASVAFDNHDQEPIDDVESPLSVLEWLQDHERLIVALFVSFVFIFSVAALLVSSRSSSTPATSKAL